MNLTISQNKQNLVNVLILSPICILIEGLEDWSEVGWPSKSNLWQLMSVYLLNLVDSMNSGIAWSAIQSEAMVRCASTRRNSTESKCWEVHVVTVWLKY